MALAAADSVARSASLKLPRSMRIDRGSLSDADRATLSAAASAIDEDHRGGSFNCLQYFRFRLPEQGAATSDVLLSNRMHRLVPDSGVAASPEEVAAEWVRMAKERDAILAWARATHMLIELAQEYRFERRRGSSSYMAHMAAAKLVRVRHPDIV